MKNKGCSQCQPEAGVSVGIYYIFNIYTDHGQTFSSFKINLGCGGPLSFSLD